MKKKLITAVLSVCMIFSLTGCTPARNGILYTVYPIGWLIERLAGTYVTSDSVQQDHMMVEMAQVRQDLPSLLESRAVFFHIGDLEPYMQVYAKEISASGISVSDLSSMNAVYAFQRYTQIVTDGVVSFVESPYYRSEAFDYVDVNSLDLNLWMDPIVMLSMAKNICEWLNRNYPEQSEVFNQNLKRLEMDLINLDAQYQALATSLVNNGQQIRFVTMTASFGNWQKTYGFQVYPVILSKYGVLPNEEQLDVIKARILADDVRYIVYEPNMTEDMIALFDRLENELGLVRVELSNLSSLTESEEQNGKDYLSLMYENLSVLETMKTSYAAQ